MNQKLLQFEVEKNTRVSGCQLKGYMGLFESDVVFDWCKSAALLLPKVMCIGVTSLPLFW